MSLNGPDQILFAEDQTTSNVTEHVKLRLELDNETAKPISIPTFFKNTAENYPNYPALAFKKNEQWQKITYKQYLNLIRTCAKAFLKLGLKRHGCVCILGLNSVEWVISHFAAIFAGGIAIGIYQTNSEEACFYCLDHCEASIVVVQDDVQLNKILPIKSRLPNLKTIIQYEESDTAISNKIGVITKILGNIQYFQWKQIMEIGKKENDVELENVLKSIGINECCNMVFTSGTVGNPKAVMLSHDNIIFNTLACEKKFNFQKTKERFVSFMPLSHVAAQLSDIYFTVCTASCLYFADADALKGTIIKTLKEVEPTYFLAVPRIWEKFQEKVSKDIEVSAINKTTLNVRKSLGLTAATRILTGAASISPNVRNFFLDLGIIIVDGYGLSETAGGHIFGNQDIRYKDKHPNVIGKPLPGMKMKILKPDKEGYGEVCFYGRNIFLGYLKNAEKTREAFVSNGWFKTGDCGFIDEDGLLILAGRFKEIIVTSGGENIAPILIEENVKTYLPQINYAFLVGEQRKFLSMLLTLKTESDPETGKPLDILSSNVQSWLEEIGCPAKTVSEVLAEGPKAKVIEAIQNGIDRVNTHAFSNVHKIKKFAILPADFSQITGELGPTLKLKREFVVNKFLKIIDDLYK